ncbi:MAG TPA: peptidylprolyl isomerase [Elusimicrobiota bacterium]|nr:peptidylprolyl isomerase [Elusimicrobiota bacterium]
MNRRGIYLLIALSVIAAGCRRNEGVLARVGKEKVTETDFRNELQARPFARQEYLEGLPGKKELLELLVRRKLVLSEARRGAFLRRPDIKKRLEEMNQEFERQKRESEERVLIGEFFRYLQGRDLKVTDDEVRNYWKTEKEYRASHILLSSSLLAEDLLSRIRKGEKFEEIAKKHSEDVVTAKQGGDVGFFVRGTLIPEFEKAVIQMKDGEMSSVVASPYGYHIIRRSAEKNLSARPYEEVAEQVRAVIEKQKFQSWIEKTKSKYPIDIDQKALEKFNTTADNKSTKSEERPKKS